MSTRPPSDAPGDERQTREELMAAHAAARRRREAAEVTSDEFRAAAEEVARLEVAINRIGEPEAPPD